MKSIVTALLIVSSSQILLAQQFTKVTTGDIVTDLQPSISSNWIDYDNDGDLDLFTTNTSDQPDALYRNNGNKTFTKITAGALVSNATSSGGSSWSDYDNDGDLDVFVCGKDNFLFTNNGDGSFTSRTMWAGFRSIAWGDYDNDGDLDLFATAYPNNVLIRNNGNGSFTSIPNAGITEPETQSYSCNWVDYDNDGDLDIFVANYAAPFKQNNFLYSNDGDGTFTKVTEGPIVTDTGYFYSSSWADYDNDGDLDLFVASSEGQSNSLYRNNGNGNFVKISSGTLVTETGHFSGGSWADYDNDGDLDIFVTNRNGDDSVYRNDGGSNFTKILVNSGGVSSSSAWGDLDNDGDLDLFIANSGLFGENANALYLNNGNGNNWINIKCVGTISNRAAFGAKIRIKARIKGNDVWQLQEISGGNNGGLGGQNSLNVEFGLGDASIIEMIRIEWPSRMVQILTNVSVNQFLTITEPSNAPRNLRAKAGFREVALTWEPATTTDIIRYRIYGGTAPTPTALVDSIEGASQSSKTIKNLTAGTTYYFRVSSLDNSLKEVGYSNEASAKPTDELFTDMGVPLPAISYSTATWMDFDSDNDLDIFLTGRDSNNTKVTKLYRNENGNFQNFSVPITPVSDGNAAWGDYDNDNKLDLFLTGDANASGGVTPASLLYHNERGSFAKIEAAFKEVYHSSVAWGDKDNDGDQDLFLSGEDVQTNAVAKIYENEDNKFVDVADPLLLGARFGSVAWGDYDNEGDLDVVLAGSGIAKIYRNDNGGFVDIAAPLEGVSAASVAWGDYDSDGDLDLALSGFIPASFTPVIKLYKNDQNSFFDVSGLINFSLYADVAWGDYDNDGDLDLLVSGFDNNGNQNTKIFSNEGTRFVDISAPLLRIAGGSIEWGDYDNDGDLDILVTGEGFAAGLVTKIYRNNISRLNTTPAIPSNLRATANSNSVTLNWNKATDNETPQNGLIYNLRVGTTVGGSEIVSPMADVNTGYRKIPKLGNVNHNTSWTIKNLKPGKYYWSVQTIDNAFAGSPFATEQSFTIGAPGDTTPPAAPQNVRATAGDRQITLNWNANTETDFLRYRVYGGTAPNPTTKIDSTNSLNAITKAITGLTNGTRYYFRITAVDNSLNESGFSNEASATPSATDVPPAAPQNVRATAGDRQITLNWNANTETDFLRYRIYGGIAPNPTTKIDSTNSLSATTKTITNLTNGTRYYFRLTAVDNSLQESSFSNEVSATPSATDVPPAAPQNVQASAGIGAITLTWNANTEPDFLRYRIYSSTDQVTFAKVDSVSGANNTSRTIAGLVNGVTYYFRVTAVDAGALESAPSNIVSARPQADVAAPTLALAASVPNAMINTSVSVLMNASDASGVQSVTLYYRIAGEAAFSNRAMALQSGTRYSANIPASAITNRGAEFYAQASDVFGNVATTPRYPIRVICPNGITAPVAQPNGTSASDYRLFSLPLEVDDKTPAGFLAANPSLGSAEAGKYRWYAFERSAGALREYPNFDGVQITPDAGFALLVNLKNVRLKTGSGVTVATTSAYEIALPQGWSLLGNPFNFNVPLDSLRVSAGTFELWRFTGDWEINTAGLEPWQGYAIWMSQAATFSIRAGVAGLNSGASFYEVANNAAENWLIQITAEDGRSASRFNFVGQHEAANDGHDAWDLHEPLALATGVGLRLHAAQNEEALKADIRSPSSQGHMWNFTCRAASEEEVLRLSFAGVASVPPAFEVMLLDNATARAYDLRTQAQIEFAVNEGREKDFTLLAGTSAFVRSRDEVVAATPSDFVMLENFPNPFNPATQINYILPEERHVSLEIYNLHGQRVVTLVNETQARGAHTVVWRAESFGSGVYFIKLSAGREVKMRKAVLMK